MLLLLFIALDFVVVTTTFDGWFGGVSPIGIEHKFARGFCALLVSAE